MAPHHLFWSLVEELYADPRVSRSTMMGFPCVRVDGKFFASFDKREERMIVKLSEERVRELVASGQGQPFAPNGRVFREWVAFDTPDPAAWQELLEEAKTFVAAGM